VHHKQGKAMSPELKNLLNPIEKMKTVEYILGKKEKGVCVASMVKKS